jgi:exonuclease V gamma subunit
MALNLTFSNSTEELVEQLVSKVDHFFSDPFVPPLILTPSDPIHKWLQLRLAEKNGVVFGYEKHFLERFIWNYLEPKENEKVLKADNLQQAILVELKSLIQHIADHPNEQEAELYKSLFFYLKETEDQSKTTLFLQLSKSLANLFLEYDLNRPSLYNLDANVIVDGIDQTWFAKNTDYFFQAGEEWQRAFFIRVFDKNPGVLSLVENEVEVEYLTLPALFRKRIMAKEFQADKFKGSPTFMFSPAGMSHFHRNFLLEFSKENDLFLYQLNPCSTFWEDVETTKQKNVIKKWASQKEPQLKFNPHSEVSNYQKEKWEEIEFTSPKKPSFYLKEKDNALLELWGQTGKENIALWCQALDYHFEFIDREEEVEVDTSPNVLSSVKNLLLHRSASLDEKIKQDDSIEFIEATDKLRECETLKENLYNLLAKNPDLNIQDIAVLVPNIESYETTLQRVLNQNTLSGPIPYVIHSPSKSASLYYQGVKSFLNLIHSNFNRPNLIQLLRNPLIQNAFDYSGKNLGVWESWIDKLNIFYGWSKEHRQDQSEIDPSDLHTWEWGLKRMALGMVSEGNLVLDNDLEIQPFKDMQSSDQNEVEKFYSIIEGLFLDIKKIKKDSSLPLDKRIENLKLTIQNYLVIDDDHFREKTIQRSFFNNLDHLLLQEQYAQTRQYKFNLDSVEFIEQVSGLVDSNLPGQATLYTGSLSIQEYKPGSILPHKIVYLLGMNGDSFPGIPSKSTLNLMQKKRIIGDMNPMKQRQYLFLETLIQTRQKLFISWQGQNILKDEELAPSSVVIELQNFLNDSVLQEMVKTKKVSLVEFEGILNGNQYSINKQAIATARLKEHFKESLANRHKLWPSQIKEAQQNQDEDFIYINAQQIAKFIKEPLTWVIQKGLKIYAGIEEEHSSDKEWERIEKDGLQSWGLADQLRNQIFKDFYNGTQKSTDQQIESLIENSTNTGNSPQGLLKVKWENTLKNELEEKSDFLTSYLDSISSHKETLEANIQNVVKIRDKQNNKTYVVEGLIPYGYQKDSDHINVLICQSASEIIKSEKIKSTKLHTLVESYLNALILFIENPTENLVIDLVDKNTLLSIPFPKSDLEQSPSDTLLKILNLMFSYRRGEFEKYFECPLDWASKKVSKGADLSEIISWSYEELELWINEEESSSQMGTYSSSQESKLVQSIAPTKEDWEYYLKDILKPLLEIFKGGLK